MHILMTGGTGFIGRHLVRILLDRGHQLSLLVRPRPGRPKDSWPEAVRIISADIHDESSYEQIPDDPFDALAHLAWSDLNNYRSLDHMEKTLPGDIKFLRAMVDRKIPQIFVSGTCFEYGLQEGCLTEETPSAPILPYAIAKDFLRKHLEALQKEAPFHLQWGRLFYMHGQGQGKNSLLPLLNQAIEDGDEIFNMSGGEQLRDYLPIEKMVEKIADTLETDRLNGIINLCNGYPISIRRLVEQQIETKKASIELNLGHYPYPDYEPMDYWGDNTKFEAITKQVS